MIKGCSTLLLVLIASIGSVFLIGGTEVRDEQPPLVIVATVAPVSSDPLEVARNFSGGNAAWTPVTQEFDGVEMVLVPIGCFMMGSNSGDDDERPVHEQCFNAPFWIDRFEVTNAQFAQLNGVAVSESDWAEPDRPREQITWFEARDFCELRGGRLPTEVEWEYAARGPDNLLYPWGNEFMNNNVVWRGNSDFEPAPVNSKSGGASWVGAVDMSGNIMELISSDRKDYPYDRREDLEKTNSQRGLRGGGFLSYEDFLRSANRDFFFDNLAVNFVGFRCARS